MAPKKKVDGRKSKNSNNTMQEKNLVKKTARKTGERSSDDIIYSVDNSDSFTMMNIDKDAIPLFDTSDGDTSPSNNTTASTESLSQGNSDTAITRRRKSSLQKPLKIPRTRSRSKREDKNDGKTRAAQSKNRDDKHSKDIKIQPKAKEQEENATQEISKTSSDCKVRESDEKEVENSSSVSDIIYHKNEYNDEKTCSDPKPLLAKKTITYNKQNRKENRAWAEEEKTRLLESFESNKKYVDKWVRIKNECGFENRTKAQLQDKYRQITKTSHYYKADRREFVLVDENNKIVTNLMGGCKTFKERWPYDAAKRVVKYYNLKVGDTVIIADYDKLKSIHKYVVVTNEDNVIRLNALEAQYNH